MLDSQQVLELIKAKGPILPIQLAKEIQTNTLLASAVLSELASRKKIHISHASIGGSPVYYIDGQESKLQTLYEYLKEKEQRAYDLLKQKKILRDKALEPVVRVALRNIKDFAKPFETQITGQKELFWKWYLTPKLEAENILNDKFKIRQELPKKPVPKLEEKKEETSKDNSKPEINQTKLPQKRKRMPQTDKFSEQLDEYFSQNKLHIINKEIIRKNKEIDLIVKIPSAVGEATYYCKSKNKKRVNDSDLSSAFVQGQFKKLPVLFVTTGDLTKKAKDMLDKEFKSMIIKKI